MNNLKEIIEEIEITKDLRHIIKMSKDQSKVYLVVTYKKDKLMLERDFNNNYMGLEKLRDKAKEFDTEEKLINYLNLGDAPWGR